MPVRYENNVRHSFMFSCRELYVLSFGNVGFPDVNRMAYGRET